METSNLRNEIDSPTIIRLYYGTPNPGFTPYYGGGMDYHDYGKGLYCTEDPELAKEWACQAVGSGESYVYVYDLDLSGISQILDLTKYPPAYWISVLAAHRFGSKESNRRRAIREQFIQTFPVHCERYEVIRGWRANDSYFAYLSAFIGGDITYEAVIEAMRLGDLGQQVVLVGQRAYASCKQVDRITVSGAEYKRYNALYKERNDKACGQLDMVRDLPGMYIEDMLREGEKGQWKHDI
jgi:hypothetical protein